MGKRAPLRMWWSKREQDYVFSWDRRRADGHWLSYLFNYGLKAAVRRSGERSEDVTLLGAQKQTARLRDELRRRGFDPDTLTISVRRLPDADQPGGCGRE